MEILKVIEARIKQTTGTNFIIRDRRIIGGGSINTAWRISGDGQAYFVKLNQPALKAMFTAEAQALCLLATTDTLRVPRVICDGEGAGFSFLVLEFLSLGHPVDMQQLGQNLAALHTHTATQYGWKINNTIGLTPQCNTPSGDWTAFWRDHRLAPQLTLAAQHGHGGELQILGERLLSDFPVLFAPYTPASSLLHGDLWEGNYGALEQGEPVIFDPALYFGDREADLAMTTLFGGFDDDFYAAYQQAWPLDEGYRTRRIFYNLYHVLNHLNLFGGHYYAQAITMIKKVLAEI